MLSEKRGVGVRIYLRNSLKFEVLPSEISNSIQLLTFLAPDITPQFAFAVVCQPPNTKQDFFKETMNIGTIYRELWLLGLQY